VTQPLPTLRKIERALGEPASRWAGRCSEIATRIVEQGLLPPGSVSVYGHWTGPVARGSYFDHFRGLPFVQHGWVLLPGGRVLDATRWALEGAAPYLYIGPADHYDEGGAEWQESRQDAPPPPSGRRIEIDLPPCTAAFVSDRVGCLLTASRPGTLELGIKQLMWIANKSPRQLGPHAGPLYRGLFAAGVGALVPVDNVRRVERETGEKIRASRGAGPDPRRQWRA
jgi:hypothetical protein